MNEIKLFRPSWAPGLELCGHYEPSISSSPNALRGQRFHECMAKLWRGEYTLDDCPKDLWDPVDYAYGELSPLIGTAETKGIEELVPLYDEFDDFVTEGTIDLWAGWTKPSPVTVIVDYKTGQERDYWAQLYVYALALCNKLGIDQVELVLIFADQKHTLRDTGVTRALLEERVWRIVANAEDPRKPHVINRYCDYCDLRMRCPAWEKERALAAKLTPEFDIETQRELDLAPSFEVILANPELLGRFIVAYKRMRKFVEKTWEIEAKAIKQINEGVELPGCQLITNPGAETIDPQKFFELVRGHMDPHQLLGLARTIDNDAARQIFDNLQSQRLLDKKTALPTKKATSSSYIRIKE